ncbi:AvrD family protein [Kitasatospora sp. LaBMicrA B282]|uniref:AvrD family protein n=1 Tax=Kitasatospora sp. LaBMicrA B282 TaxID=3420949 RepID=UPI003D11152A
MNHSEVRFSSIDDFLGTPERRFFGNGLNEVRHALSAVSVVDRDGGRRGVDASATLRHPGDWSHRTSGMPFAPYVDCIDALALSVQLCEVHLLHAQGLGPDQRRRSWLRRYEFWAAPHHAAPHDEFPVQATLVETRPAPDRPGELCSTFEQQLGPARTRCVVQHPPGTGVGTPAAAFATADQALGPAAERFHAHGYRHRRRRLTEVLVHLAERRIESRVEITPDRHPEPPHLDLGSAYAPAFSLLDCLAVQAQLGQALLYQMDGATGVDGGRLRIPRVTVTAQPPDRRPLAGPFDAVASVDRSRLLTWEGETWRTIKLTGSCRGITTSAWLAHALPAAVFLQETASQAAALPV